MQWVGRSPAYSTWEPLKEFKSTYPSFQLEDELFGKEDGSVADAFIGKQYTRKKGQRPLVVKAYQISSLLGVVSILLVS